MTVYLLLAGVNSVWNSTRGAV